MKILHHARKPVRFSREMFSLPRNVKLISLVMLVYYIGWGISETFTSIYFKEILGSYTKLGIVAGLLPLFGIIWALLAAGLVDKVKKNRIISFILLLYLPISYIILSLQSFLSFVAFRFYHAFLATNLWLSSETYLRKYSPKNKNAEAIGLFDSAYGISLILGPVIGGILIARYSYSIFYSISIFAFLAFLVSLKLNDKIARVKPVRRLDIKQEFRDFYSNKKLRKIVTFHFFLIIASSFISILLPLFFKEIGASFFQIGLLASLFYLPQIFESYFSTFRNKRMLFMASMFFASLLFIAMFFVTNVYMLVIITFMLGLSLSAVSPIIQGKAASQMPKAKIGELYSMQFSFMHLANFIGPVMAGIVADNFGLRYIFIIAAIIFIILFFINLRRNII